MRLPDGGFPWVLVTAMYDFQSLMQLSQGSQSTITAVDNSTTTRFQTHKHDRGHDVFVQPQLIGTQDFINTYGDGDT